MAEIAITSRGEREFNVRVSDGDSETSHRVTVPEEREPASSRTNLPAFVRVDD